jgi:hypothetical protein
LNDLELEVFYLTLWAEMDEKRYVKEKGLLQKYDYYFSSKEMTRRGRGERYIGDPKLETEVGTEFHSPEYKKQRKKNNVRKARSGGKSSGNARLLAKAKKLGMI